MLQANAASTLSPAPPANTHVQGSSNGKSFCPMRASTIAPSTIVVVMTMVLSRSMRNSLFEAAPSTRRMSSMAHS